MAYIQNNADFVKFVLRSPQTGQFLPGEVVTGAVSKDGGVYAVPAGVITDQGLGRYQLAATAADMNAKNLHFVFTSPNTAGADVLISTELFSQADLSALIALVQAQVDNINAKTTNLPADPASEGVAAFNTAGINANVDANEVKIDSIQSDVTALQGDVTAIKTNTDNLPADPASETNATANTNGINSNIDANENKIDNLQSSIDGQDTNLSAIKAKTDNLPADPTSETNATANASGINSNIDANESKIDDVKVDTAAIRNKTVNLPADPASESSATANTAAVNANIDANEVKIDAVKVDTAAIKLKSDNLPADPASESNATANTAGINANIDANEVKIDAVKVDTAAIKLKTDNLPADPASEGVAAFNTAGINANVNANGVKIDTVQGSLNAQDGVLTGISDKTVNLPADPASESNATANTAALNALITALNDLSPAEVRTQVNAAFNDVQIEDYAASGVNASPVQLLYQLLAILANPQYSGSNMIARKLDGATQAMQFVMDDANNPTDQKRVA